MGTSQTALPPDAEHAGPSGSGPSGPAVDPLLVQQTRQQIRVLVREIAQLAQSDCSPDEFYEGFLSRLITALACVGGAIWTVDAEGRVELRFQINLTHARLDEDEDRQLRHGLLLRKIAARGEACLVQPHSGSPEVEEAGNPTDFLLVIGPIHLEGRVQAIVEIFQRPGGGPTTQRGYLRFLVQMCDLAADYLKNRRLRHFSHSQQLWDRLEQFIHAVHRSLDPRDAIYTIANEGRRLIEADRVSVAMCRGRKCRVEVVSGLDTINRRAAQVKQLGRLATAVVRGGQPLWYHGATDDLPPQIDKPLQQYVDTAQTKLLAIVPLYPPRDDESVGQRPHSRPLAALVVEQLRDGRPSESLRRRVDVVARHSAEALHNALEYHSLFLLPLWRALGRARAVVALRHLPKTLAVLLATVLLVASLLLVPADFDLAAPGTLRPAMRRQVFAPVDGTLVEVPVQPGQRVRRGQVLARLENNQLESEIIALQGRRMETQKQMMAIRRTLLDNPRMRPAEENQLSGQLAQLREALASIDRQLEVYQQLRRQLIVTSPIDGQVATWQVRDKLLHRPVQRGQILMTVVNPEGAWELELAMPERRMGHVDRAARQAGGALAVTFVLATHPGQQLEGQVVEIDRTADVRDEGGNAVRIRVAVNKQELPDLRNGAKVTARVHCGRRPLGYVWFHELLETVQAKILFWF